MRATLNIVFGFMLLLMQSMASIAPHSVDEPTTCRCCSCGSTACSTPQATPAPTPSPLASQQVSNDAEKVSQPSIQPTLEYPATRLTVSRPVSVSSSSLLGQPLYKRFCALLI